MTDDARLEREARQKTYRERIKFKPDLCKVRARILRQEVRELAAHHKDHAMRIVSRTAVTGICCASIVAIMNIRGLGRGVA